MLQERYQQTGIVKVERLNSNIHGDRAVILENISGKWNQEEDELTLDNLCLEAKSGKLLAIIGTVGAGKSSIIQAILGEFPCSRGKISVNGKISYSPQEAWVFSGSIRQNILFGMDFDENRYWKVIEACALKHDLHQWEFGDRTLVGERGVSLSGGQKARVSLARAVYREADIYLLDDPLSAVDVHVGRHLFNNCIRGFLKNKAVILVTHQLQYLQDADEIIVMKGGLMEDKGSFEHLQKNGMDFSSFLAKEEKEEADETETETKERLRTLSVMSDTHSLLSELSQSNPNGNIGIQSVIDEENKNNEVTEKKLEHPKQVKEQRSTGAVKTSVYTKYFTSGAGWTGFIFMIVMNLITQAMYSGSDIWLSYWTSIEEIKLLNNNSLSKSNHVLPVPSITTSYDNSTLVTDLIEHDLDSQHFFNLGIYAAIVISLCIASMIRTIHYFYISMRSSIQLHNSMFDRILRAPCRFFDTNPVGIIHEFFLK